MVVTQAWKTWLRIAVAGERPLMSIYCVLTSIDIKGLSPATAILSQVFQACVAIVTVVHTLLGSNCLHFQHHDCFDTGSTNHPLQQSSDHQVHAGLTRLSFSCGPERCSNELILDL